MSRFLNKGLPKWTRRESRIGSSAAICVRRPAVPKRGSGEGIFGLLTGHAKVDDILIKLPQLHT
jgi:hypothetical protein